MTREIPTEYVVERRPSASGRRVEWRVVRVMDGWVRTTVASGSARSALAALRKANRMVDRWKDSERAWVPVGEDPK
jgi:hypothetical protein